MTAASPDWGRWARVVSMLWLKMCGSSVVVQFSSLRGESDLTLESAGLLSSSATWAQPPSIATTTSTAPIFRVISYAPLIGAAPFSKKRAAQQAVELRYVGTDQR